MGTGQDPLQVGDLNPRVTLGRLQGSMAEKLLDVSDVRSALEKMSGQTVTEGVTGDGLVDPGFPSVVLDDAGGHRTVESTSFSVAGRRRVCSHTNAMMQTR
jgi:hypothetical protein